LTETKGSDPGDKMKRKGVCGDESGKILARSKGKDFVNYVPKYSYTMRLKPSIILSGRKHLKSSSLLMKPRFSYFSGKDLVKG
jgi:hypothetical protein